MRVVQDAMREQHVERSRCLQCGIMEIFVQDLHRIEMQCILYGSAPWGSVSQDCGRLSSGS